MAFSTQNKHIINLIHVCCKISIVGRNVSLSTTLEDVSFIFQTHNGYIGLNKRRKLLMWYIHTHDGCYLGILKGKNNDLI